MRTPIIIGNWKMNNGPEKAHAFHHELSDLLQNKEVDIEWAIAPPILSIPSLIPHSEDGLWIPFAVQNVNEHESGAFTGEISVNMLKEYEYGIIDYVIIGHSERRQMFNETNATVNAKIKAVLKTFESEEEFIIPVVAFGETEAEFDAGKTEAVVKKQLNECLEGLDPEDVKDIVLAYEPIWAIGTGKTATPERAQEICKFSRSIIEEMFGKEVADEIRIQYGGSMNPENVKELMEQPDIDGGLVGGASLSAESFFKLITFNK